MSSEVQTSALSLPAENTPSNSKEYTDFGDFVDGTKLNDYYKILYLCSFLIFLEMILSILIVYTLKMMRKIKYSSIKIILRNLTGLFIQKRPKAFSVTLETSSITAYDVQSLSS